MVQPAMRRVGKEQQLKDELVHGCDVGITTCVGLQQISLRLCHSWSIFRMTKAQSNSTVPAGKRSASWK